MNNDRTRAILDELFLERLAQFAKWGEQKHPMIGTVPRSSRAHYYGVPTEQAAKDVCKYRHGRGNGSFTDILVEELAEVVHAADRRAMRAELVQLAAVAVQMIERIDIEEPTHG